LRERDAKADEMLGFGVLPIGPRDPFDGVVVLFRLQAQQTHQLQAIDVKRVYRKGLLAAQLRVEMAAGLHVPDTKLMERNGARPVVSFGGLIGLTFRTVHIGAFRPLKTAANS
jgi:hypothetical protein